MTKDEKILTGFRFMTQKRLKQGVLRHKIIILCLKVPTFRTYTGKNLTQHNIFPRFVIKQVPSIYLNILRPYYVK
jgi:hypothetical protein